MRHSATCGLCGRRETTPGPAARSGYQYPHSGAVRLRGEMGEMGRWGASMIDADTFEEVPPHVYELLANLIDFECLRSAVYDSEKEILTVETLPEMSAPDTRRLYSTIEDAGFELEQLNHLVDGYSIDFKLG